MLKLATFVQKALQNLNLSNFSKKNYKSNHGMDWIGQLTQRIEKLKQKISKQQCKQIHVPNHNFYMS